MDPRYLRNVPALTEEDCRLLQKKKVLVAGCGGIGGYLVELLLRIGLGAIRVCDGDVFEETNLNRQLLCQLPALGAPKARTALLHSRRVNPEVTVEAIDEPLTRENVQDLIRGCDAVLDGLDNVESRKLLARACGDAGIPYIYGAIGGWVAQAALCMPGQELLEILYPQGADIRDSGVLSFTPALCASVQAALCVRLLTGRPVQSGKLLHFDLLNQEFQALNLG